VLEREDYELNGEERREKEEDRRGEERKCNLFRKRTLDGY